MEQETISLTDTIKNAINDILSQIFSSIDNNLYSVLDNISFVEYSDFENTALKSLLGSSPTDGILLLCNSLFLGFLLYYAISFLMSHLTFSKTDSPIQFLFRSIIFLILMNYSYYICLEIIKLISILSSFIIYLGETFFNQTISFTSFINSLNYTAYLSNNSLNIFSFSGIIKSFISYGLINLLFSFSLRYIMIQIFILISPFAFLSLINTASSWFFKSWIKSFVSLLLIQVLVSLILVLNASIPISDSIFNIVLHIGTIYALTYSNSYLKNLIGGISTTVSNNVSYMKNYF